MTDDLIETVKKVTDELRSMDHAEFRLLLEKHSDGDVARALTDFKKEMSMEEFFRETFSEEFLTQTASLKKENERLKKALVSRERLK